MRLPLLTTALLAHLATSKVLPVFPPLNFTSPDTFSLSPAPRSNLLVARENTPPPDHPTPDNDPEWEDPYDKMWNDALCRGERLLHAMTLGELDAAWALGWPYLQSPWDGDLKQELETWGWHDSEEKHRDADYFCNFEEEMSVLFSGLGVDGRSAQMGGPNHCFFLEHRDGSAVLRDDGELPPEAEQKYRVDGREYRVTGAYSRVGINRHDGIIYFLHRRSPEKAAQILWDEHAPDPLALPKLRSSSDLAFGLWNRVPSSEAQSQDITKFISVNIVNEDAEEIIRRALEEVNVEEVQTWPGTEFDMSTASGKALLGSPNGLAAAYFLLQHHRQLGSAKSIHKVKLVTCEDEGGDPCLIFYVGPVLTPQRKKRGFGLW